MSRQLSSFEYSVPVVVVGGGACGCTAALAAKAGGAEVLLIEQDAHPYGTTSMSQGLIAAAGTRSQAEKGVEDSAEVFFEDIMTKTRGLADPVIARTIAKNSGPAIDWLTDYCDIPFEVDLGFKPSYGNSRFRAHGWPGHGGEDLLNLMHRRLDDHGVDVMLGCRLTDIFTDESGAVSGISITQPDGSVEELGCEALVLACGGFAGNREMIEHYMPELKSARYNGHEGSRGDGILLGAKLGGKLADMSSYQGYAMLSDPHGITLSPISLVEGAVLVNAHGKRFVDESIDIAGMMLEVLPQPEGHVWVIYDQEIEQRSLYVPEMAELKRLNAPKEADDLAGLAEAIKVDPQALAETMADVARADEAGEPDAMGRDWSTLHVPEPPYLALKVTGAYYHTQGGLQIDEKARVVKEDGTPIPNLFAGGGNARAVSGPGHWGYMPAMGLCTAVSLGRVAGMSAAEVVAEEVSGA
ncbi:FAD-dependent oxidoreductase [Altererythrobacter sp. GH1-8]|uniref:FAD-dependent oxidoreductase n=1 Tax=Altererythrobacter sp. GH1-8 TaxID=3349333 RepID=UPI00374D3FE3